MAESSLFELASEAIRMPFTQEVASFCEQFCCDDPDLDDFFISDNEVKLPENLTIAVCRNM